jgi:AcrR family transcriptional regulator
MKKRRMSAGAAESRAESATPPASTKARGREEVRAAVLAAAGELFAERGPSAVSVRDIASRAGVNHGLIHRHFGSKEGLLRETLELMAGEIANQMPRSSAAGSRSEAGPNGEMGYRMLDLVVERSPYWRILARQLLDGIPVSEIQRRFPVVEQMIADRGGSPGDGDRETRLDVASLIAMSLGWLVFEPFIVEATGLAGEDTKTLRRDLLARVGHRPSDR